MELADAAAAGAVTAAVEGRPFAVSAVERKASRRNPPVPLITSTLQQEASAQLRFSPKRTMRVAQQLYEGVELGAEGATGLITYMRTDSIRVSEQAVEQAVEYIRATHGAPYVGSGTATRRPAKAAVAAQDAHEAIRPTSVGRTPEAVAAHLTADQQRLYELIWRRFVASRMSPARLSTTRVDIDASDHVFRLTGTVVTFDGFLRVLPQRADPRDPELPALQVGEALTLVRTVPEQHFTQPPPRYTEATLIREMEERGIGRPSTYAPTIDVIEARQYVRQEERRLHPTPLGQAVNEALQSQFPEIVDIGFTAQMEERLDAIETGGTAWVGVVRNWFTGFAANLERAEADMPRVRVAAASAGEACPQCGADLVVRTGRFGEFIGCSRYPECTYIKGREDRPRAQPTGDPCPQCGKPLVVRQGRRGPFVGCSGYPSCRHIAPSTPGSGDGAAASAGTGEAAARPDRPTAEPTGEACPDCGKPLVRRMGRFGPFVSCSGYPGCKYRPPRVAGASPRAPARRAG